MSTKEILIVVCVIVVLVIVFAIVSSGGSSTRKPTDALSASPAAPGQLEIIDDVVGTGAEAVPGKTVVVHYTGTLTNGTKFDSSRDRGTPFEFVLGSGQVIRGWDEGVKGMKVGGKRRLVIPPEMAYGAQAVGPIPANSTLLFEVELLQVK